MCALRTCGSRWSYTKRIWPEAGSTLPKRLVQCRRVGDLAGDGGGGGDGRVGEVDLGAARAHAADEVAVGRGDGHFVVAEDAHVSAQTGAAGGVGDDAAGVDDDVDVARFGRFAEDALGARRHDEADVFVHLAPFQDLRGDLEVGEAAVGTAADERLVDLDLVADGLGEAVAVGGEEGVGDDRFEGRDVDFEDLDVGRVGVGVVDLGFAGQRFVGEEGGGDVVVGDDAALGPGFDGHVAHGEAVVHAEVADGVADELEGAVERAVDADHADDFEDDVLTGGVAARFAGEHDFDGLGDFEPVAAGDHREGEVGGAHAGRESAQRAVGTGVRVGADDDVAGNDEALLGEQGVFDAHVFFVEEVLHLVLLGEVAADARLVGGRDVLGGDEVIEDDGEAVGVGELRRAGVFERFDGDGGGDVVADDHVDGHPDDLTGVYRFTGVFAENLFGNGLSHSKNLKREIVREL